MTIDEAVEQVRVAANAAGDAQRWNRMASPEVSRARENLADKIRFLWHVVDTENTGVDDD